MVRIGKGSLDHLLCNSLPSMMLVHPHIANPGEGGFVGDYAHVTDLAMVNESTDDERRVVGGALNSFARHARRPVGGGEP